MKYEELLDYYNKEKETEQLQEVPKSLFKDIVLLVDELLNQKIKAEHYHDIEKFDDMLRGARLMGQSILERREHKILEAAYLKQSGINFDRSKLATHEVLLFEGVDYVLEKFKTDCPWQWQ